MPLFSLVGYGVAFVMPVIGVLFATRVAESTLDYSLSNTVRQSLSLVTAREAKYKAKQVIDAFVWRAGDTVSALVVWLGVHNDLSPRGFIAVNLVVAVAWTGVVLLAGRAYLRRRPLTAPEKTPLLHAKRTECADAGAAKLARE